MYEEVPVTLVADDQPDVVEALRLLLRQEGFDIDAVDSPKAVLERLQDREYDLVLMDLNYALDTASGEEGLDLLERIRTLDHKLPVVVMTAWGSVPLAVEAMRRGARDFIEKPWENAQLLATLRAHAGARHAERKDTDEAAAVQRNLLPREIPRIPGCDIALVWRPAMALSGDYVDVLQPAPGTLCFAIADVVGKGAGAALLMSNVQAAVRLLAAEDLAPDELTARLNRNISASLGSGKFITFFYGEMRAQRLAYTNAGHPPPVLVRATGDVVRLAEGGTVLGVFSQWRYGRGEIELESGDRLVLFTDGLTEASDFGEDRLIDVLCANRHLGAHGIEKEVMAALAGYQVTDDLTLLVLAID